MQYSKVSAVLLGSPALAMAAALQDLGGATRYVPGPISAAVENMILDPEGVLSVGADGVLRSWAPDLSVIDYQQLDPQQLVHYGQAQLERWSAFSDKYDLTELERLADPSSKIDGRLVVAEKDLFQPSTKPSLQGITRLTSSESKTLQDLKGNTKGLVDACTNYSCLSLQHCLDLGRVGMDCRACFYNHGPPFGICFQD